MHKINLCCIVFLVFFATASFASMCDDISLTAAFCSSDWVSHVKVISRTWNEDDERISIPNVPFPFPTKGPISYDVEHSEIFRKPSNMITLPIKIETTPDCYIEIVARREYLLSGSARYHRIDAILCGQVAEASSKSVKPGSRGTFLRDGTYGRFQSNGSDRRVQPLFKSLKRGTLDIPRHSLDWRNVPTSLPEQMRNITC